MYARQRGGGRNLAGQSRGAGPQNPWGARARRSGTSRPSIAGATASCAPVTPRQPGAVDLEAAPPARTAAAAGHGRPRSGQRTVPFVSGLVSVTVLSSPNPSQLHPRDLAERILTSRSALEGERKQVTVLFASPGSRRSWSDRDPEEAQRLLDPLLERMMEAVHRYEGTVNHFWRRDDGAVRRATGPRGPCALGPVMRAPAMQRRSASTPKSSAAQTRSTSSSEVGLNSGEVVVARHR